MGWAAPVAGVISTIGGALIGRSGQNRAIGAQERATQAQIQLERERDAARQQRYQSSMEDYRREKTQYDQIRRAMLSHYGINLPGEGQAGAGAGATGVSLGELVSGAGRMGAPTKFGPAAAPAAGAALGAEAPAPGGDLGGEAGPSGEDLFDWRRYGVPQS
jgi:hypothetical protein